MKLHVALVAAAVVAALPVNAFAATASVNSDGELHYDAAPGEANDVQISESPPDIGESPPGVYTITDQGAVIEAGDGCVQLGDHQVSCSPSAFVLIILGDLADNAELTQGGGEIVVYGGAAADRLTLCIDCSAVLAGNTGADVLQAGDTGDGLAGGAGADAITGGRGTDDINGGPGNDTIASGDGNDDISPGSGNDHVDAGGGRDFILLLEAPRPVVVYLSRGTLTGWGTKTLVGFEDVEGTAHADRIYGDRGANFFFGMGGDDLLVGRGGRDDLLGSSGEDRLFGRDGDDRLLDHRGPDLLVGGGGADYLSGGPGSDRMFGKSGADTLFSREQVGFTRRRDLVAGGRGVDRARVDAKDVLRSIELFY